MATSIVSVEEEESRIRNELSEIILRGEKEHGPLEKRLAMLKDQFRILTDLELELINIMEKSNIIAYEKESQDMNSTGNQLIKGKSLRKESESNMDGPSTIQPIQDSLMLAEKSIKHDSITE